MRRQQHQQSTKNRAPPATPAAVAARSSADGQATLEAVVDASSMRLGVVGAGDPAVGLAVVDVTMGDVVTHTSSGTVAVDHGAAGATGHSPFGFWSLVAVSTPSPLNTTNVGMMMPTWDGSVSSWTRDVLEVGRRRGKAVQGSFRKILD